MVREDARAEIEVTPEMIEAEIGALRFCRGVSDLHGGECSFELRDERVDQLNRPLPQPNQNLAYGGQFRVANFVEGYLKGDFDICVKLRCGEGQLDPEHLLLFFIKPDPERWRHGMYGRGLFASDSDFLAQHGDTCCHKEQAVFIDDIKVVKDGEEVIVRSGVVKWLRRFNPLKSARADAPYISSLNGFIEFLSRPADRELISVVGRFPILGDKRNDQVVEDGTDVMNYLAGDYGDLGVDRDRARRTEHIAGAVFLKVFRNKIVTGVRRDDRVDTPIEIMDTYIGPVHFGSDTLQSFR